MTAKPAAADRALEAEAALALIEQYLAERRPRDKPGTTIAALSGDASTRRYYRLKLGDLRFVLALYPEPFVPQELSYLTVRGLLEGHGLPVPGTEDVDGGRGVVLQEDLGDETLQALLQDASPARTAELYREAVDRIAQLQLRAAQGPQNAACFQIAFDIEKLAWELHYFLKHFLEGHRGANLSVEDRAVLSESFHRLSEEIASWPRVLCHRDYHSRNLMVHGERLVWIDFQDARLGPDTYDLASLLRDSYVDLTETRVDDLIRTYLRLGGASQATPEAFAEYRRRFDLMSVQRNLKALGTFGHQTTSRSNPVYIQYIPRTLNYVRTNLERYSRFARLRDLLAPVIQGV